MIYLKYSLIGLVILFVISFVGCKPLHTGILNYYYGPLSHNFIDTSNDFSISLTGPILKKEHFIINPSKKDLKRNLIATSIIHSFKNSNVLYLKKISNGCQLGVLYLNQERETFLNQYITDNNRNKEISDFTEIKNLKIPREVFHLQPVIYKYYHIQKKDSIQILEAFLFLRKAKKIYRFIHLYKLQNSIDTISTTVWENKLAIELATFKDSVNEKMKSRLIYNPLSFGFELFNESNRNYMMPLWGLNRFPNIITEGSSIKTSYLYINSLFHSFVGDIATSRKLERQNQSNDKAIETDPSIKNYKVVNAEQQIGKISRHHNIIMINESHLDPFCRVFASRLLDTLYKNGFRHIFVETLGQDSLLNERKYPLQRSGVYTSEPMFGNFIRNALRIGFKVLPYECELSCDTKEGREQEQAKNIIKNFPSIKNEKILVYAGHGHIYKKSNRDTLMAEYFEKFTGIIPFCIDQTRNEKNSISQEDYSYITNSKSNQSVMLIDSSSSNYWVTNDLKHAVDAVIIHPPINYINHTYADFLLNQGKNRYDINLKGKKYKGALLQIMIKQESSRALRGEAIPILNLILNQDNKFPVFLNPGDYYLTVYDTFRKTIFFKEIKIKK